MSDYYRRYDALSTIQKNHNLNKVVAKRSDDPAEMVGGASHEYTVQTIVPPGGGKNENTFLLTIQFQRGPRNEPGSVSGVLDEDLLEIVRDRLQGFQAGDYACEENARALAHIEEALMWLNKRKEDRAERGVLGTYQK